MMAGAVRRGVKANAIALVIAALGCAPSVHVDAPAEPPREGLSSVRALTAPTMSGAPEQTNETITPAYAGSENERPRYPTAALQAGCLGGTIALRIYVDAAGDVVAQQDIPGRPVRADSCDVAFLAAAEAAVAHWKFAPAFRLTRIPAPDSRAADRSPWQQTPIAVYLDFEFRFDVVDGKGVVLAR